MNRRKRVGGILLVALVVLAGGPGQVKAAPKHCYECHKEKESEYSKAVIHRPVADKDCEVCHKRHGFSQQLTLKDNGPGLCTGCHQDFAAGNSGPVVHPAVAEGLCWTCHNPHASERKGLLRNVEGKAACFVCHGEMLAPDRQVDVHPPFAEEKCEACHLPHSGPEHGLLRKEEKALCADCHRLDDQDFGKAHTPAMRELPCATCHDPHSAAARPLVSAGMHPALSGGDCGSCHESSTPGEGDLVAAVPELCLTCHDQVGTETARAHPHPPASDGDCLGCHKPHHSSERSLLVEKQGVLCANCHESEADAARPVRHKPYETGDCTGCHAPHGSDNAQLLLAADNALCTTCHTDTMFTAPQHAVAADDCRTCHTPHTGTRQGLIKEDYRTLCTACHEVDKSHAVKHDPYDDGNCAVCHSPHSGEEPHLVRSAPDQLCTNCHTYLQRFLTAKFKHEPATECLSCHNAHGGEQPKFLKQPVAELCQNCHEREVPPAGGVSHSPYQHADCGGCHNPHGADLEHLIGPRQAAVQTPVGPMLRYPKVDSTSVSLCKACHADRIAAWDSAQVTHVPVKEGKCSECHAPHVGARGLLAADVDALCGRCHESGPTFVQKHGGMDLAGADCVECHDPHAAQDAKLLKTVRHAPFADGTCESCHASTAGGFSPTLSEQPPALCANCHENYTDGGRNVVVHAPVEAGECTSCHAPHAAAWPKLLRAEGAALCTECHDLKTDQPVVHDPFQKGECQSCHPPHKATGTVLTVRQGAALCLDCHTDLAARLARETVHKPVASSCGNCHEPHSGGEAALLKKPEGRLCAGCHAPTPEWKAKHLNLDLVSGCTSCHDPHAAPQGRRALLYKYEHKPFADGACAQCHDAKGIASATVCRKCHAGVLASADQVTHKHPPVEGQECLSCHSAHVAPVAKLLPGDGAKTCGGCHQEVTRQAKMIHPPRAECETCHQPHGGNRAKFLTEDDQFTLCLTCHEGTRERHFHPMGEGRIDPTTKAPLVCTGCHDPHRSDEVKLLNADPNRTLCTKCHELNHS
jgi:predicted CXXCH cytochrome family protein